MSDSIHSPMCNIGTACFPAFPDNSTRCAAVKGCWRREKPEGVCRLQFTENMMWDFKFGMFRLVQSGVIETEQKTAEQWEEQGGR
jgi:hypothetical protein